MFDVSNPGTFTDVVASISGTTLTLTPNDSYVGTFQVRVTVSDGALSDTETFLVTIQNNAPEYRLLPTKQCLLRRTNIK